MTNQPSNTSSKKTSIRQLFNGNNWMSFNRDMVRLHGYHTTSFIYEIIDKYQYFKDNDGLDSDGDFYLTIDRVEERIFLGEKAQREAIKKCKEFGFLSTKVKGLPAKRFFHFDEDKFEEWIKKIFTNASEGRKYKNYSKNDKKDAPLAENGLKKCLQDPAQGRPLDMRRADTPPYIQREQIEDPLFNNYPPTPQMFTTSLSEYLYGLGLDVEEVEDLFVRFEEIEKDPKRGKIFNPVGWLKWAAKGLLEAKLTREEVRYQGSEKKKHESHQDHERKEQEKAHLDACEQEHRIIASALDGISLTGDGDNVVVARNDKMSIKSGSGELETSFFSPYRRTREQWRNSFTPTHLEKMDELLEKILHEGAEA